MTPRCKRERAKNAMVRLFRACDHGPKGGLLIVTENVELKILKMVDDIIDAAKEELKEELKYE